MKSILSDVVSKYSRHTENICSDSLALVINESLVMQDSFRNYIIGKTNGMVQLSDTIEVISQATSKNDSAIPDLQISDKSEKVHLIEAKFWAGLTEQQPNGYINRIASKGGSLAFLVPERRINSLRAELKIRISALYTVTDIDNQILLVDDNIVIYLLSWNDLIDQLWTSATQNNDQESVFNLYQLRGLIQKLDNEGFIPFESELFTSMAGKQRDQLIDLLDAVVDSSDYLDTKKLSYGGGKYSYQRFFKIYGKFGGYMLYSSELWTKHQETPLFFCIAAKEWSDGGALPDLNELKARLNNQKIGFLGILDINSYPALVIPLRVSVGMSKEYSIDILNEQVISITSLLK